MAEGIVNLNFKIMELINGQFHGHIWDYFDGQMHEKVLPTAGGIFR